MSPVPRLSTEDRIRAVVLHEEGYSCNKIALKLKVARITVQQIIKKHKETGSVEDRKGRGRKRITTSREDRLIVKQSLKDRRKTSRILANELKDAHDIKVSSRTVRRRLVDSGLKYCRAKKKPLLSEKARAKRLDWGRQHRDYDWSKVIFSLHRVEGTINAAHYIKILKFCALPSMRHHFKD
eukprot:gene6592-12133_t